MNIGNGSLHRISFLILGLGILLRLRIFSTNASKVYNFKQKVKASGAVLEGSRKSQDCPNQNCNDRHSRQEPGGQNVSKVPRTVQALRNE